MSLWSNLSAALRAMLAPMAEADTGAPLVRPNIFGRSQALGALGAYIEGLTFYRSGGDGKPEIPFAVKFFKEWPDAEVELKLPAIGILSQRYELLSSNLIPTYDETTIDVFGKGTVLRKAGLEWKEVLQLELRAAGPGGAERGAVLGGLIPALNPHEGRGGVVMRLPRYYNQTVRFASMAGQVMENEAEKGRRNALVDVEMTFEVVSLVRYTGMRTPIVVVDVVDHGYPFDDGSFEVVIDPNS